MSYSHWDDKKLKLPALHQAARRGNLTKVKQLLKGKGKAKANEANEFGDTPIMWAAHEGNASVVAYLIAVGANVKATDKEKMTPLHLATIGGHCEIIAALLSKGANAKAMDGNGFAALHFAAGVDCPESIQMLTQSKVNANMRSGIQDMTALHFAAHYGHPAAIRALVKAGADVNRAAKYKVTPLHTAVENNRSISVATLIDKGADLNAKDNKGSTPLHLAADKGYDDVVDILLDAGAKSNLSDKSGKTPLYWAQRRGHHRVAKMLIDIGQFADAKSPGDETTAEKVFKKVSGSIVYIKTSAGRGSGVIVDDNLVVTNDHVVEDGADIRVYEAEEEEGRPIRIDISDRRPEVTILDGDAGQDFRLLDVPDLDGEAVEIRSSHDLRIGEEVYAIGNPAHPVEENTTYHLTLSGGVISQIRDEEIQGEGKRRKRRLIQTNAAISPGSSGGGLFDKDGNLIGIITAKIISEDVEGIGFAIPADLLFGFLPGKR